MNIHGVHHRTLALDGGVLRMLDQRLLPFEVRWLETRTPEETAHAISDMVVRGAGAIGATAAAGVAQAAVNAPDAGFFDAVARGAALISATRPTARNLFYGVEAVLAAVSAERDRPARAREAAVAAAVAVADDDAWCCEQLGQHGLPLVPDGARVSTHCNAGWLAFVDWGSALAPVYAAHRAGRRVHVWADETRPRGQGARLTAFELGQEGVSHDILADGAIGLWMRRGLVDLTIVGADRIAANGDVANKVGTSMVALAAAAHGVPFYVAAPTSTIDPATPDGDAIPIEERSDEELLYTWGWSDDGRFLRTRTASPGSAGRNPAFDVTPASLIRGILTEKGLVPATPAGIASVAR